MNSQADAYLFLTPLDWMFGQDCLKCERPISVDGEGILVQENVPGGAAMLFHRDCLYELMLEGEEPEARPS